MRASDLACWLPRISALQSLLVDGAAGPTKVHALATLRREKVKPQVTKCSIEGVAVIDVFGCSNLPSAHQMH